MRTKLASLRTLWEPGGTGAGVQYSRDRFTDLFADDAHAFIPGTWFLAGHHHGRPAILAALTAGRHKSRAHRRDDRMPILPGRLPPAVPVRPQLPSMLPAAGSEAPPGIRVRFLGRIVTSPETLRVCSVVARRASRCSRLDRRARSGD